MEKNSTKVDFSPILCEKSHFALKIDTFKSKFINIELTICVVFSFLPLYALDDDDFKNNQLVIIYLKTCIRNQRPLFVRSIVINEQKN